MVVINLSVPELTIDTVLSVPELTIDTVLSVPELTIDPVLSVPELTIDTVLSVPELIQRKVRILGKFCDIHIKIKYISSNWMLFEKQL